MPSSPTLTKPTTGGQRQTKTGSSMLAPFIYDTSSLQDRLIQDPAGKAGETKPLSPNPSKGRDNTDKKKEAMYQLVTWGE
ncbi:hypothetical protein G7Z17_g10514 [Cylindrodendrum hubeiense]|uniref:Uncharacterized protein n=1 Tax=Cylindrodendrum hubeiense TaxID=595255 RepID=A0A9P5H2V2_9HYPO|nr:hypothetical protein G7Z17_g10514 [Cylindrodendrum hubeiense]